LEGLERLEMVDAEDNCCLEEKVGPVPTEPGVYVVQIYPEQNLQSPVLSQQL
jgi:hypothetical protein